jgi:hypothetical protein
MLGRRRDWEGTVRRRGLKWFDNDRRKPLSRWGLFFFEDVFFVVQEGADVEGKSTVRNQAAMPETNPADGFLRLGQGEGNRKGYLTG